MNLPGGSVGAARGPLAERARLKVLAGGPIRAPRTVGSDESTPE